LGDSAKAVRLNQHRDLDNSQRCRLEKKQQLTSPRLVVIGAQEYAHDLKFDHSLVVLTERTTHAQRMQLTNRIKTLVSDTEHP
jgi:hypothetical protein